LGKVESLDRLDEVAENEPIVSRNSGSTVIFPSTSKRERPDQLNFD
jgi:hypothetical protein